MLKIREKTVETAQGMVEFALVLPLLLLVILGIFAFGHLLFAYSSVTSASREAARYGAVVGVSENGLLRFQDCAGIRAAAVRVGGFAGVSDSEPTSQNFYANPPDPGVYIGYDHGDSNDSSVTPYASCPGGAGAIGPNSVALGDRIMVRVTVQYQPIVPLVNLPSFPLSATTRRTIITSLPVGEAPTAEPGCVTTSISFDFTLNPLPATMPSPAVVGEQVIPLVTVLASNGQTPTGKVNLYDLTDPANPVHIAPFDVLASQTGTNPWSIVYTTVTAAGAPHYYGVTFTPTNTSVCYAASQITNVPTNGLIVLQAPTITEVTSVSPEPSTVNQSATINFRVKSANPGGGTPTSGTVTVSDGKSQTCNSSSLTVTVISGTSYAIGSCSITWATAGIYDSIYAKYSGNTNYIGSTSVNLTPPHTVTGPTLTEITSISPEPSIVNESTTINFRVSAPVLGAPLPGGTVTVLNSSGTTLCSGPLVASSNFSTGSCTYTWTAPGTYQLHAVYPGDSNNLGSTSANVSHKVSPYPLVCPSFTASSFTFNGSNFTIGIQNTDPNYAYSISSMALYWPGSIGVGQLSQIKLGSADVFSAQNANQNFTNTGFSANNPVPIPNGHKSWTPQSLASGQSGSLQFLFTNPLLPGPYYLTVTFASPDNRTCTTNPINFTH